MSKSEEREERIDNYPLFYEEIGHRNTHSLEQEKKDAVYEHNPGLNADDIAKLGDDLQAPIKDISSDSNPLQ